MTVASSLSKVPGEASVAPLLTTSEKAFGMVDFFARANQDHPGPPAAKEGDLKGPLTVAWAVELPRPAGSSAQRGGRAVVVGSSGVIVSSNWQSEDLRGTAAFIESSVSWLVSRPALVSIPKKPAVTAGLRVSEDDLQRIALYTVLCMPLASILFGVAVYLRRKSGERRGKKAVEEPAKEAPAKEAPAAPAKAKPKKKKKSVEDSE
jgi:hypothetical protein